MRVKIFNTIMDVVSEATEVSQEVILSRTKTEDAVEARTIVIYLARKFGLPNSYIQKKFNRKSRESVTHLQELHYILEKSSFAYRETTKEVESKTSSILKVS